MDDRDLEARLSARLHQRFDRAEPPVRLGRDISDARLYARTSSRRSGVISLLAAAAVLAVAAVALGAWFSRTGDIGGVPAASPSSTASPSPSPSASPTPAPSPTPASTVAPTAAALQPCKGSDLAAQLTRWEGAAGSRFGTFMVNNPGETTCMLSGTPGIRLIDGQGAVFLDSAVLGAPPLTLPAAQPFTMIHRGGSKVYVVVQMSNYCGATPSSPVAAELVLPGGLGPVLATSADGVPIEVAPCNGASAPTTLKAQSWSTTPP